MRIVGGEAKGRPVRVPKGCRIRPTADRIKESLFALLNPLAGRSFLDLFAGSGNVGLEALSRGARSALFVECDRRLTEAIHNNLQLMGFSGKGEVLSLEAGIGLKVLADRKSRFDILFADPPYGEGYLTAMAGWWTGTKLLTERGFWVLQHSVREPFPETPPEATLRVTDQRRYGDTMLTFLKNHQES
ncbi:MAG: 16S rRNA (guanine(966)-N(2))-methyltransferase RsmD [Syntrophaceae bacterium]|nr:16S rRNA (guanine(966)-N(2))-methyltransferase RsmD [Syntrophaceae bacterium]